MYAPRPQCFSLSIYVLFVSHKTNLCIFLLVCSNVCNGDFPCVRSFQLPCVRRQSSLHTQTHAHALRHTRSSADNTRSASTKDSHWFELVCTFTGIPAPQIRWEKDNHVVTLGEGRRIIKTSGRSQLEINNLTLSDAGVYTCLVSNVAGMATRSVRLEVRGEGVHCKWSIHGI